MTKDEALRLALEALENWLEFDPENFGEVDKKAITAIKAALEAKDEPVANNWSVFNTSAEVWDKLSLADAVAELTPSRLERGWSAVCVINKDNPPLYTTPPQRTWVGLTNEEHMQLAEEWGCLSADWVFYAAAVERKVKERNT